MNPDPSSNLAAPRRRHRWTLALLILAVIAASLVAALWTAVDALGVLPVNVAIDGEPVLSGIDLAALPPEHKLLLAAGLAFLLLALLIVLPLALCTALLGMLLAALAVVGLPLLAALAAAALALSPVLLVGWLLWRALRPSSRSAG